jgi:general secretion pathway protein J
MKRSGRAVAATSSPTFIHAQQATGERGRFLASRGDGIISAALACHSQRKDCERGRLAGVSRGDGIISAALACHSQRGFTLLEILLATALLAAGLAFGFATLRAATATVERGEIMAERSERMRAVEGFLRRRLSSALPVAFATVPESGRAIRFVGERDRLRFVADLPDYLGRGGPSLHDIAVFEGNAGKVLGVSFSTVLAGETIGERDPRPPEPLVEGLASVRFRYRALDQQYRLSEWLDAWPYADILPLQVSVEIETETEGRWPALVVMLPQGGASTIPAVAP